MILPTNEKTQCSELSDDSKSLYASLWLLRWLENTARDFADILDDELKEEHSPTEKDDILFELKELLTFEEFVAHKIQLITRICNAL